MLARLGLRVGLAGVVGDDAFGRFMLQELRERGVDVRGCRIDPARPTGATVILARPTDRAILTATGTIGDLRADDVPDPLVRRARHVHVASYYLQPALEDALPVIAERAHRAGATLSVDPNGDPTERWDGGLRGLLPSVDVFLPNEAEATAIAADDDVAVAARTLHGAGPRPVVAVKCGSDGAIAVDEAGLISRVHGFPVTPVDAVGAGDAFDAGFLAAWLDGQPIGDALALGAACGALSTRGVGGVASLPTRAEAEALALGSAPEAVKR